MTVTNVLRPFHAWFRLWDALAGPVARIVAIAVGSMLTAGVLAFVGVPGLVAAVVALLSWIGLAVAQEHDERVRLPADPAFSGALAAAVGAPPLGLAVTSASGPPRAWPREPAVFVLGVDDADDVHPFAGWHIQVLRDRDEVELSAGPDDGEAGGHIARTWRAIDADVDAAAVAAALRPSAPT